MHAVARMTEHELGRLGASQPDSGFGGLATSRGHLPLKAMAVEARVTGLTSQIELEQTFVNVHGEPIEATYVFPLPDRAAVTPFVMTVGARRVEGILKERGEARREYTTAIQQGHRAAITEEDRAGVFTMRVGNLMPGDIAVIELSMTGPLPAADGEVTLRFPLVVAPRYIPGAPLPGASVGSGSAVDTDAVPDASRITPPVLLPGFPSPVRLSLSVLLDPAGVPISDVRSSLHAVTETTDASGARKLRVEPGERLDRDFILRFKLGGEGLSTGLVTERDASGSGGTFMLTLVPPSQQAVGGVKPRDVVFVLDRSGSMEGWKMVAARRAVGRMLDSLGAADRFSVIAFDDHLEWPAGHRPSALIEATDRNRFRALEWVGQIDARGGTEMAEPLEQAADLLAKGEAHRDRVLVLVTDGQVGDEDRILRELAQRAKGARVFAVGIDRAVNAAFLERLSAIGGGGWELVESEERLDDCMDRIHRRIGAPVLTELTIASDGLSIEPNSLVPPRLPDAFAGVPVVVFGRFSGSGDGAIHLYGADRAGQRYTERLVARPAAAGTAARLGWARGRIRALEDRFAVQRGDAQLEQEIVRTSLAFGVLSRFTAFVAVDRAEVVNPGGKVQAVTQPVESPSGWASGGAPVPPGAARAGVVAKPSPMPAQSRARSTGAAPPPPASPAYAPAPAARRFQEPEEEAPALEQAAYAPADLVLGHSFDEGRDGSPAKEKREASKGGAPKKKMARLEELVRSIGGAVGAVAGGKADASAAASPEEKALVAKLLRSAADAIAVAKDDDARRRAVEALWMALEGVLFTLRGKGADASAVQAVYDALSAAFTGAGAVDAMSLWPKAAEDLAAFAGVAPPAPPPPSPEARGAFWK